MQLHAQRDGDQIVFSVEGEEIARFEAQSKTLGLAIESCELRFRDVAWKLSEREDE